MQQLRKCRNPPILIPGYGHAGRTAESDNDASYCNKVLAAQVISDAIVAPTGKI